MRLISKFRHGETNPAAKDYAEGKIGDKIRHHLGEDDAMLCELEFDYLPGVKELDQDFRIDLTLTVPHQHLPIRLEEIDRTFEMAVDKLVDRLDQPLAKYKDAKHR